MARSMPYPPPRTAWDRVNPIRLLGELSETRYWMYLLLLPSALLICAVVIYPTLYGMQLSFREMRLNRPDLGTDWVGFKHYQRMLTDPIFWVSLRNTAVWVTFSIVLEFLIGLVAALALNRNLPGSKVLAVLILLPYFLPNVVAGHMWALMLIRGSGSSTTSWSGSAFSKATRPGSPIPRRPWLPPSWSRPGTVFRSSRC